MENFNEYNVSHIMMYAMHIREIYCKLEWLAKCVAKRIAKSQAVTTEHLANCSTMNAVMCAANKWCKGDGVKVTSSDRREAAKRIANEIITEWV